jgi:hypothetical protein
MKCSSRGGSVSIVIDLRAGGPVFDSWQGQEFCLFATASRPALGSTHPPMGTGEEGEKRPGREVDHSPFHLAPRLRKRGAISPLPHSSWRGT